jgi:hypothetical protein
MLHAKPMENVLTGSLCCTLRSPGLSMRLLETVATKVTQQDWQFLLRAVVEAEKPVEINTRTLVVRRQRC